MQRCRVAFGLLCLRNDWHLREGLDGVSLEMGLGMNHNKVGLAFGSAEVLRRVYGAVETASLELLL